MDLSRLFSQPRSRAAASSRHRLLADSIEKPGYVVENKGVSKTTGRLWPNVAPAKRPVMDVAISGSPKRQVPSVPGIGQPIKQQSSVAIQPRMRLRANIEHHTTRSAATRLVKQSRQPSLKVMDVTMPRVFAAKPTSASVSASVQRPLLTSNPGYIADKIPQLVYSQSAAHNKKHEGKAKAPKKHDGIAPAVSNVVIKEVVDPVSAMREAGHTIPQLVSRHRQPTTLNMPRARSIDGFSAPRRENITHIKPLRKLESVQASPEVLPVCPRPDVGLSQAGEPSLEPTVALPKCQPEIANESRQSIEQALVTQSTHAKSYLHIKPQQLVVFGTVLIALALGALFPGHAYGQWLIVGFGIVALAARLDMEFIFEAGLVALSAIPIMYMLGYDLSANTYAVYSLLLLLFGGAQSLIELLTNKKTAYS